MFCGKCGTKIAAGAQQCPKCGAPIRNRTVRAMPERTTAQELLISFVENGSVVAETTLDTRHNARIRFGSNPRNDLVVSPPSHTVSGTHGVIHVQDGWCTVHDDHSLNGLYLNGTRQQSFRVTPGDVVSIGEPRPGVRRCVMVVGSAEDARSVFPLRGIHELSIGRDATNMLVLPNPTVSAVHAVMRRDGKGWVITDLGSTNGTQVDNTFIRTPTPLYSGSSVSFGNAQTIFLDECLFLITKRHGVNVIAQDLVRYRKNGKTTRITTNHVSLHIKRGDFVAIVGGSGCGKSTLLNELSGEDPADEGRVFINGTDLYANYEQLKTSIGYVPQQDIVYDNLRLQDMLESAAKLRMQPDTTPQERMARVNEVIGMLELNNVRGNLIKNLSGGQKKRASIAVELMADPRLLFLDEPTSGLDPGIERTLMKTLARMAHDGRTIILVTHTTLNLHLCDQVVFLGAGGKLCFAGRPQDALSFFGVTDFVDVYGKMEEDVDGWAARFARWNTGGNPPPPSSSNQNKRFVGKATPSFFSQFATLSWRYAKLVANDRSRLALLLLQAPLLAGLISIVAGSSCFSVFEDTKSCLFALSCAAFWVGILDSIQEICKEREIVNRDYNGGVRLGAYLCSKVLILSLLCLVQSAALTIAFCTMTGMPETALVSAPGEMLLSLYLTTCAAMCTGLLVSALVQNPDRAIAIAPLLIMPQILFSGMVFELKGVSENISYAVTCRWTMEALGTTANLNSLDLLLYGEEITVPQSDETLHDQTIEIPQTTVEVDTKYGPMEVDVPAEQRTFDSLDVTVPQLTKVIDSSMLEHEPEDMYEYSLEHLMRSWLVLGGTSLLCTCACYILLRHSMRR